jgi:hypothetical protein
MTNIVTALENITPGGIAGIMLIFGAIPLLLQSCSWLITKYTKSKSGSANDKKIPTPKVTNEEQTR